MTALLFAAFAASPALAQTCTTTPTYGGGYETRCDGGQGYETRPSYGGSWQTYEKPGNPYTPGGFADSRGQELPEYYQRYNQQSSTNYWGNKAAGSSQRFNQQSQQYMENWDPTPDW